MKKLLDAVLNNRKKPVKISGRIISSPRHLSYVIATVNGRIQADAPVPYEKGRRVVVYNGLIQGYAGTEPPATSALV